MIFKKSITYFAFILILCIISELFAENCDVNVCEVIKLNWDIGTKWSIKQYCVTEYNPSTGVGHFLHDKYKMIKYEVLKKTLIKNIEYFVLLCVEYTPSKNNDNIPDPLAAQPRKFFLYIDSNSYELKFMSVNDIIQGNESSEYLFKNLHHCNSINDNLMHKYPIMSQSEFNSKSNDKTVHKVVINEDFVEIILLNKFIIKWKIGQPWWYECEDVDHPHYGKEKPTFVTSFQK